MTDLFSTAANADRCAALLLQDRFRSGETITRALLNAAMTEAYGGSDAQGRWTQRESFEVLEHALALHLRTRPYELQALADVRAPIRLMANLPTQTVRSEEQLEWQQFSTPADIAALAVLLANAQPGDVVLEPSAGNGLLVAQLRQDVTLQLNELDPARRSRLAHSFPGAQISGHDGAAITSLMAASERPTLVLMNPPFSRSLGRGADDLAAVRHLQAALRRLRTGGRLVAIMSDWFGPSARLRDLYGATLRDVAVRTSLRLEKCYAKHGTSIAVRLYVIDKAPGTNVPSTIQRSSVAEFLDVLTIIDRLKPKMVVPAPPVRKTGTTTLFRAVKSTRPAEPRAFHAPTRNEVLPVEFTPLDTPAPILEQTGVYLPYRPSRLVFTTAGEHPTALVESVAMGSIPAPVPHHVPRLPERTVADRLLSASQLETVVYAGDAWTQMLPGKFRPSKEGVGLELADDGREYRKGFFLGDGTGAGKGRQIAACILDNWLQGRRRHIWITKNEPLLEDARRDWTALGGMSADIQPLTNWKIDDVVKLDQGVIFVTYPALRSARSDHTRLKQLIDWAREDFDGVIAFDEAHEMGGVAGGEGALGAKKGSQQGICGVLLQNHLPGARVLYASATGASDVNNLAYAVRLGLWGPETAFGDREQFISGIRKGGIAAMELVARDLKATGLYMARALSFAGVEYDILKHALTPDQIKIYDTYADAWGIIHRNMEQALELTGVVDALENATLNSGAKASARSRFESTKQRFFGQVLLSLKLPTVIAAVEEHLTDGKSVVLQLVTTAESILNRRLGELSPDERADLEIDLSPREYVIDYLQRAFPTRQMKVFTDDTGTARSMPMVDDDGNAVYNPEAEAARERLIEHLCALPPIMSALDAMLEHFGHDNVAEITGRTKRLVSRGDGGQKLESRSTRTSQVEASAFMEGRKRVNTLYLWALGDVRGYCSRFWMTFRQAEELGAHVRKGERGAVSVYYSSFKKTETNIVTGQESEKNIRFLRHYIVFNADQIDGLPAYFYAPPPIETPISPSERQAAIDAFVDPIPADVRHGGNEAFFSPTFDYIQMPSPSAFRSMDHYASTRLHETVHWSGHASRLGRKFGKRFGDKAYAFEELVAEIGAGLACAEIGLPNELHDNHASYVAHWLGILRADKTAIIHAASKAEQAYNYLRAFGEPAAIVTDQAEDLEVPALLEAA